MSICHADELDFHNELLDKYGNDVRSLDWGSRESQRKRFVKIFDYVSCQKPVLDVGCGLGDLALYISPEYYTGIDINHRMVEMAKKNYPKHTFCNMHLSELDNNGYDYVVGSGVFGVHWNIDVFEKMFAVCTSMVVVNFLSALTPYRKKEGMTYMYPERVVYAAERLTKKFIIDHSYLPNDFTLVLYK